MQSAEDTSNLMDTDHSTPLSASSPSLINVTAPAAAQTAVSGGSTAAAAGATATGSVPGSIPTGNRTGESLDYHCRMLEEELQTIKDSEAKLKQQYAESQRRERILARRLAVKEQEMQDYASQIAELKAAQAPGQAALRSALLDPAVNILFQKLKSELQQTKAKLEETQNELSAWKFTPDSNTGKRLMAKCRLLYQENEELGKMTSNGRLAKLEGELALQKSYNEEVKKSQLELDDFLQEMDEDVEGMQSTIVFLQQELKHTKDEKESLEKEVLQLRSYVNGSCGGIGIGGALEDGTDPTSFQQQLVNGSNGGNKLKSNSSSNCPSGGVGVGGIGGGVVVGDQQSESQFSVYQNRTHCVGGGNATSGGNVEVLQNGGCDDNELAGAGEQESAGQNSSRLCAGKKVNSRTAKSTGGKKRNYQEDPDDEAGGEDEEDSGHYEDGSNNGKMLAPDSELTHDPEEPSVLSSSNKRMTRSGKGSKITLGKPIVSVKKLRRASVLSGEDDETVEGANGAN